MMMTMRSRMEAEAQELQEARANAVRELTEATAQLEAVAPDANQQLADAEGAHTATVTQANATIEAADRALRDARLSRLSVVYPLEHKISTLRSKLESTRPQELTDAFQRVEAIRQSCREAPHGDAEDYAVAGRLLELCRVAQEQLSAMQYSACNSEAITRIMSPLAF